MGAGVDHWQPGDRVVLGAAHACGRCSEYRVGGGMLTCEALEVMAFHYDGA